MSFSINLRLDTISSAEAVRSSSGKSLHVSAGGSGVASILSVSAACESFALAGESDLEEVGLLGSLEDGSSGGWAEDMA